MNMVADAVVVEPVSTPNSLLTGKRTGNFSEIVGSGGWRRRITAPAKGFRSEFPYSIEQGTISRGAGNSAHEQGSLSEVK